MSCKHDRCTPTRALPNDSSIAPKRASSVSQRESLQFPSPGRMILFTWPTMVRFPQGGTLKKKSLYAVVLSVILACFGLLAAAPAQAVVVGVCNINAQNPHPSNHVTGTINAVGTVSCSMVMQEIYVLTTLERMDGVTWTGNTRDYFNSNYEQSNAATSCNQGPGTFRTRVSYVIYAPPGVNPAYATSTVYSPWIGVICGGVTAATGQPSGTNVTVSVPAP